MTAIVLIHGGLYESMTADRFWVQPGVTDSLRQRGFRVIAPDRLERPQHWHTEVEHIRPSIPAESFILIGASNGCSVAALLALEFPVQIARLILAWPATAGDPQIDATTAAPQELLTGEVLRGSSLQELARISALTGIVPSIPENPAHQRRTVDALLRAIPGAQELAGSPEPPRPGFKARQFTDAILPFLR